VASLTTRPLYPRGKSPRHPLDRRLGRPQSRSGRRGKEKILGPTGTRIRTPIFVPQIALAIGIFVVTLKSSNNFYALVLIDLVVGFICCIYFNFLSVLVPGPYTHHHNFYCTCACYLLPTNSDLSCICSCSQNGSF
jgi:hypothetical protein